MRYGTLLVGPLGNRKAAAQAATWKQDTEANKGTTPLSEEVPYQITLIRLSQVSLDRRRREKVIWEMITEHKP